jgi:hypothetical protein
MVDVVSIVPLAGGGDGEGSCAHAEAVSVNSALSNQAMRARVMERPPFAGLYA